jgi:preprotein translocase subunit SecE
MNAFIQYIKESKAEMKNVTWPTREQTLYATLAVLVVSGGIAYYLGLFDYVFTRGLEFIITKY